MNAQEKKELMRLLQLFFAQYDINARDMTCKNPIATYLKEYLEKKGRWKSLARGKSIELLSQR
jgi:hypothetical protein